MRHLQSLYKKYSEEDLVILGFNSADNKEIALEFLRENGATFTNIIDSSVSAMRTYFDDYKCTGVPLNYIIDRQGKIVKGWYGEYERAAKILEKLGIR